MSPINVYSIILSTGISLTGDIHIPFSYEQESDSKIIQTPVVSLLCFKMHKTMTEDPYKTLLKYGIHLCLLNHYDFNSGDMSLLAAVPTIFTVFLSSKMIQKHRKKETYIHCLLIYYTASRESHSFRNISFIANQILFSLDPQQLLTGRVPRFSTL